MPGNKMPHTVPEHIWNRRPVKIGIHKLKDGCGSGVTVAMFFNTCAITDWGILYSPVIK